MMICSAYFDLLEKKTDEKISISEICEKALVARKTFYNNFSTKEDIIGCGLTYFLDNWAAISDIRAVPMIDVYRSAFEFVGEQKELFKLLYKRNIFRTAEEKLTEFCFERWHLIGGTLPVSETLAYYYVRAGIASFVSILKTWIERDFLESEDEIVSLAAALIADGKSLSAFISE